MNTQIDITENGTTTLATAGKYCDRNIDVNVNVEDGGKYSLTEEDLAFSGDISQLFQKDRLTWLINKCGDLMSFDAITNANNCFTNCESIVDLSKLHINLDGAIITSLHSQCEKLEKLPKVSGSVGFRIADSVYGCNNLKSDEINNFFAGLLYKDSGSNSIDVGRMFSGCHSARDLTQSLDWLDRHLNNYTGTSSSIIAYGSMFQGCYALDEVTNLPVYRHDLEKTSNAFSSTFYICNRLKNVIFKTDNGKPYSVKWKSQTIDLSSYIGYCNTSSGVTNYNSGITRDKEAQWNNYESLKNDPDVFTCDYRYSRYNHDSAVNTINSLPDTSEYLASAGGTNTIKFKGTSGSATDGGAINTLTEEEIAVAVAKGWTVTMV